MDDAGSASITRGDVDVLVLDQQCLDVTGDGEFLRHEFPTRSG